MATQDKILASAIQLDFNSVTGLEVKHVHLNDVNDFLTLVARIRRNDFVVTAEVFDNEQTVKIHMTDLVSRDAIHIAITADAYESLHTNITRSTSNFSIRKTKKPARSRNAPAPNLLTERNDSCERSLHHPPQQCNYFRRELLRRD